MDVDFFHTLTQNIIDGNTKAIMDNLHSIISEGNDINEIIMGFIEYFRNIMMLKIGIIPEEVHKDDITELNKFTKSFSEENLLYAITILMDSKEKFKTFSHPNLLFETTLLKLINLDKLVKIDNLQNDLSSLEIPQIEASSVKDKQPKSPQNKTKTSEQKTDSKSQSEEPQKMKSNQKITLDQIKDKWSEFTAKIRENNPVKSLYLKNIKFKSLKNNTLFCTTDSPVAIQQLEDFSGTLKVLLKDFFTADFKIDFDLSNKEKEDFIHAPTIKDIKKNLRN